MGSVDLHVSLNGSTCSSPNNSNKQRTYNNMPWTAPSNPSCPACSRSVYPAESFMAADRRPFHKQCVRCLQCKKGLNPATINEHQSQLYCKNCYDNVFMSQDYSSGTYGGIVTPDDIRRREEEEKRKQERAEKAKRERRCPTCDMKAYPDDAVKVSELFFHKICLKCSECSRSPDENTPMMMGPKSDDNNVFGQEELEPYCKFCFAKKFKVSAINIAETVTITPEMSVMCL